MTRERVHNLFLEETERLLRDSLGVDGIANPDERVIAEMRDEVTTAMLAYLDDDCIAELNTLDDEQFRYGFRQTIGADLLKAIAPTRPS